MGCLNGKFLSNRSILNSTTIAAGRSSDFYPRTDDSINSSSPDEDKLLYIQRVGNGTNSTDKKIRVPKISKFKKFYKTVNDDSQPSTSTTSAKSTANGLFGRRLGKGFGSKNIDLPETAGHSSTQNGSILHSLGTLLENGGRATSSPKTAGGIQNRHREFETNVDSPLTPDRLHKNFQERLLTSQISRNNQRLTDSQLDFFRMLDEKIAQGREEEWEGNAQHVL